MGKTHRRGHKGAKRSHKTRRRQRGGNICNNPKVWNQTGLTHLNDAIAHADKVAGNYVGTPAAEDISKLRDHMDLARQHLQQTHTCLFRRQSHPAVQNPNYVTTLAQEPKRKSWWRFW